jgi:hypothetical protein
MQALVAEIKSISVFGGIRALAGKTWDLSLHLTGQLLAYHRFIGDILLSNPAKLGSQDRGTCSSIGSGSSLRVALTSADEVPQTIALQCHGLKMSIPRGSIRAHLGRHKQNDDSSEHKTCMGLGLTCQYVTVSTVAIHSSVLALPL